MYRSLWWVGAERRWVWSKEQNCSHHRRNWSCIASVRLPYDTRAFEQLVAQYKGRVFRTAFRLLGNRQDAEDQAQEVFLKVFRSIKGLNEPAAFVSWLDRMTVRMCLDLLETQQRRPMTVTIAPTDEHDEPIQFADIHAPGPEEAALRQEVRRCLEGACVTSTIAPVRSLCCATSTTAHIWRSLTCSASG